MATVDNREQWLAERRTGLGGSDIAKICGLSKFGTALDVYLDKIGEGTPVAETNRMRLGTALEPFVTDLFIEATGKRCIEYKPTIHGTGERSCCLGNLDRIVVEPHQDINEMVQKLSAGDLSCVESILECKTCVKLDDWYDDDGNMKIPEYYMTQILWYMSLVPSCKRVYVAVFCTGLDCKFDMVCIERNDKLINGLVDYAVKWWNDTVMNPDRETVMAKLVNEAQSIKMVLEAYPKSDPDTMFVLRDDILAAKFELYKAVTKEIADFEKEVVTEGGLTREELLDSIKLDIAKEMKEKELLVADDAANTVLATFKKSSDTVKDVTDWEMLATTLARSLEGGEDLFMELKERFTRKGVVTRKGSRSFKLKAPPKAKSAKAKKAA